MDITEGPLKKSLRRLRDAGWIKSSTGSIGDLLKTKEEHSRNNNKAAKNQVCTAGPQQTEHDVTKNQ